ncbi:MAG: two-component sensor histidine kinase, partial [Actinobacteria bacterium]
MTAGVTLLVVVAFVIPLGLLVRRQADERARLEAETTAQTLAAVVVRATA